LNKEFQANCHYQALFKIAILLYEAKPETFKLNYAFERTTEGVRKADSTLSVGDRKRLMIAN